MINCTSNSTISINIWKVHKLNDGTISIQKILNPQHPTDLDAEYQNIADVAKFDGAILKKLDARI